MPVLKNPRHEKFALLVSSGKTQADAYRAVWPNSKLWKKKNAVHSMASQMATKVAQRVKELQDASAAKAMITKDEAVTILAEGLRATPGEVTDKSRFAQEMTIDSVTGKVTIKLPSKTALFAELSKALGWYAPEKTEIAVSHLRDDDLLARILARKAKSGQATR